MMYMVRPLGRGYIIALVGCGKPVAAWYKSMPFLLTINYHTMKHLFYSALIAFTLLSCSDNDSSNTTDSQSIVGAWQLETTSLDNEVFDLTPCELHNTVNFTDAGRVTFSYYYGNNDNDCHTDAVESGNYVKNGNSVTITWDESDEGLEVYHLSINELSDSTLKWHADPSEEGILRETYSKQ